MNRKYDFRYYSIVIIALIGCVFCCLSFFYTKTGNQIYRQSLKSVVEIKAETANFGESYGTAVFVDGDGTLITNAHVVTYSRLEQIYVFEEIKIRFAHETEYRKVTLIKYDTDLDLAVLKLEDTDCSFKAMKIANSSKIEEGDIVYAVGNLNNVGISLTEGTVSNKKINVEYDEINREVIQCDLTIAEGNSGGALLDDRGRLIGITSFRLKDKDLNVIYGICYCIPANAVVEYIKK